MKRHSTGTELKGDVSQKRVSCESVAPVPVSGMANRESGCPDMTGPKGGGVGLGRPSRRSHPQVFGRVSFNKTCFSFPLS